MNGNGSPARFSLGQVVVTSGIQAKMQEDPEFAAFCRRSLNRHSRGDWGELGEEDKASNQYGVQHRGMIMSVYTYPSRIPTKVWIITDPGWAATTILFPNEY